MIDLQPNTVNLVNVGVRTGVEGPVRVELVSQACNGDELNEVVDLNSCAVAGVVSFYLDTTGLLCGWYTLSVYLLDGSRLTQTDANLICSDPCQ